MKMSRYGCAALALIGLLCSHVSSAAPPEPKAVATAAAATEKEQVTPEVAQKRKEWTLSMHKTAVPKKGCFTAAYPKTDWQEVPCVVAPNIPMVPRHGLRPFVVGNGDDISAQAPSGTISQAIGRFENISNVTSETGLINNAGTAVNDAYSLQINTDFMTSTACAASPNAGCLGWEQWVYYNDGSAGVAFIQYWLIRYNTACPGGWNQFSFPGSPDIYCYRNSTASAAVPNQPITNMGNWTLSGTVTATSDSVSMGTGANVYTATGDNSVAAAGGWTFAEFNIFGPGGGADATFNSGASVDVRTEIIYGGTAAPNCLAQGTTGETNNLSFGPTAPGATGPGPAVIFQESTAGGAASNCAAAATVGDTHLRTFGNLFYDFQAAGDFTLAEVAPDFEVQTRQVSGAPTWPDATVNKLVAARFGKTKVAICASAETRVLVDGKVTAVEDGKPMELAEGVGILRRGDVYQIASADGNSVRAKVNSVGGAVWVDVNVGLGKWPSAVKGLIANVNGNVNQIATRDNFVLTNPFKFDELYHRFADSWRVTGSASMLSACDDRGAIEVGAPKRSFLAKDLEASVREKTIGVCTAAGVKPGPLLDACALDVAVIGNDAAAKVFVDAMPPAAVGTIIGGATGGDTTGGDTTGGGDGILQTWWWLFLLLLLLAIIIIWFLRRKKP